MISETLVPKLLEAARSARLKLATAESCTGGLVAAALTDIAGSSDVFDRGFITYSNEAKVAMLSVLEATIAKYGAVSSQTAAEMAHGAVEHSLADIAVSITGIAGPGGGSPEKPVGLVWFGLATRGGSVETEERRFGAISRSEIRSAAVETALTLLLKATDQRDRQSAPSTLA